MYPSFMRALLSALIEYDVYRMFPSRAVTLGRFAGQHSFDIPKIFHDEMLLHRQLHFPNRSILRLTLETILMCLRTFNADANSHS